MKTQLTNLQTKIYFNQYGREKIFVYNGEAKGAKTMLKLITGIKKWHKVETETMKEFRPEGNHNTIYPLFMEHI
jgi:hypothetical protein